MKEKVITKESDPEWVQDIASYVQSMKREKRRRQLRELYKEYLREGLRSREAWEKAKQVLAAFQPPH
jgi:hypothetical protein